MTDLKLIWSPYARLTYLEILEYLKANWSLNVVEAFVERTNEVLDHITRRPLLYPYFDAVNAYRSVITKQVSLFYRVTGDKAELLLFWDNRQDPAKLLKLV